jgi:hypothetical protein
MAEIAEFATIVCDDPVHDVSGSVNPRTTSGNAAMAATVLAMVCNAK